MLDNPKPFTAGAYWMIMITYFLEVIVRILDVVLSVMFYKAIDCSALCKLKKLIMCYLGLWGFDLVVNMLQPIYHKDWMYFIWY